MCEDHQRGFRDNMTKKVTGGIEVIKGSAREVGVKYEVGHYISDEQYTEQSYISDG